MNLITRYIVFDPVNSLYLNENGYWTNLIGSAQQFVSEMDARDALSITLHKNAQDHERISGAFQVRKIWTPQIANQKTD